MDLGEPAELAAGQALLEAGSLSVAEKDNLVSIESFFVCKIIPLNRKVEVGHVLLCICLLCMCGAN